MGFRGVQGGLGGPRLWAQSMSSGNMLYASKLPLPRRRKAYKQTTIHKTTSVHERPQAPPWSQGKRYCALCVVCARSACSLADQAALRQAARGGGDVEDIIGKVTRGFKISVHVTWPSNVQGGDGGGEGPEESSQGSGV